MKKDSVFPDTIEHGPNSSSKLLGAGLTKREYFAASVLPTLIGVLQRNGIANNLNTQHMKTIAEDAFNIADAMIEVSEN